MFTWIMLRKKYQTVEQMISAKGELENLHRASYIGPAPPGIHGYLFSTYYHLPNDIQKSLGLELYHEGLKRYYE